jgi:microcystin-dependent protein
MSKVWIKGEEITAEALNETAYGLHVVSQNTPNMTVRITSGVAIINNVQVRYTGGNSPTITAPSANPRIDLIVLKQDGTIEVTAGTENASPTPPLYPSDKLVLAEVYLRTGMTQIKATDDTVQGYISLDARPVTGVAPAMPTGVIFPFAGSSAPSGFVLCDGSAISRSTYAALYAIISTVFGAGNGSTTFNVPDLRGSAPIGAGQKSYTLAPSLSYSAVDTGNDLLTFSSPHKFKTGTQVALSTSGVLFKTFSSSRGSSSGSCTVDGSGNITVGGFASVCPVGTPLRCTSQSSSNFTAGNNYWVISNNGSVITVSTSPGGGIAGSGNSGSVTFQELSAPIIEYSTDSCTVGPNGDDMYMNGFTEDPQVDDVLYCTNSISISGVGTGGTYYVVAVDLVNRLFKVSNSQGGSPNGISGGGWAMFTGTRNKIYVVPTSKTKVKLASSFLNAMRAIYVDLIDGGSGTHTLTASVTLTDRQRGDFGGEEDHTLSVAELPSHRHPQSSSFNTAGSPGYSSASTIRLPDFQGLYTDYVGGNTAHENMQPFVTVNYIIKT